MAKNKDADFKKKLPKPTGKHVYMLLDRSGSMANGWDETLGSINGYVEQLEDDIQVSLYAFDNVGFDKIRSTTPKLWERVTSSEIHPRGGTPLYDAAGKVMDEMFEKGAAKSLFVVMTDGYENMSQEYTLDAVKGKLKLLEQREWPVVFLGANFREVETYTTGTFQIRSGQTLNSTNATRGKTMDMMSMKTSAYMASDVATAATMDFSAQEKMELNNDESKN